LHFRFEAALFFFARARLKVDVLQNEVIGRHPCGENRSIP
jgi:hypothetical protein